MFRSLFLDNDYSLREVNKMLKRKFGSGMEFNEIAMLRDSDPKESFPLSEIVLFDLALDNGISYLSQMSMYYSTLQNKEKEMKEFDRMMNKYKELKPKISQIIEKLEKIQLGL